MVPFIPVDIVVVRLPGSRAALFFPTIPAPVTAAQFLHAVNHLVAIVFGVVDFLVAVFPPLLQLLNTTPPTAARHSGALALGIGLVAPDVA